MEYAQLVLVYGQLESTTKRLAYTKIISEFLKKIPTEDLSQTLLLLEGRVFPRWDEREVGIASRLMIKAISIASGSSTEAIEKEWKKTGDLGTVTENLISKKKQATLHSMSLSVKKVFVNLQKIATIEGHGSVDKKMQLVAELLTSANGSEAKFIVRTILNDLRIGVGEGTIRDSIVWCFFGDELNISYDETENKIDLEDREIYNEHVALVQQAYDLTNDFGTVAETLRSKGKKGLSDVEMKIGIPIKVMLALKVDTIEEGFERCGTLAAFEFKYDGMRMQIHRDNDSITIFTRRLENITKQFPEVVSYVKEHIAEKKFIIDAEAVGYSKETGKYQPFQSILQRIKRKYDIDKLAMQYPVEVNVFDIINYKGHSTISKTFSERRELLDKIIIEKPKKIRLARCIITDDHKKVEAFYKEALDSGNEGLMVKKLDAPYKPGARTGYMVKLKPTKENFDLIIIKAEWGEGKRSSWLSSFTLACKDPDDTLLEVGKVSTGLKEKPEEGLSFSEMTELLKPLIKKESGKEVVVKPSIVIEVAYEEIQKSPTYTSGFALRFPRVIALREDRGIDDVTTLDMVKEVYDKQVKKGG